MQRETSGVDERWAAGWKVEALRGRHRSSHFVWKSPHAQVHEAVVHWESLSGRPRTSDEGEAAWTRQSEPFLTAWMHCGQPFSTACFLKQPVGGAAVQ